MEFELLGEQYEIFFEVANAIIALGVLFLAVRLAMTMRGGALAVVWKWLVMGVIFFALLEVYGMATLLGDFEVGGLSDLLEFFAMVSFVIAFYKGKNIFSK